MMIDDDCTDNTQVEFISAWIAGLQQFLRNKKSYDAANRATWKRLLLRIVKVFIHSYSKAMKFILQQCRTDLAKNINS